MLDAFAGCMRKSDLDNIRARSLIGRNIRWEFFTPAVSCQSGYRVKREGRVSYLRHNPTTYFGRNTLVVNCEYVTLQSVTHFQSSITGRWIKFEQKPCK
jgi:hypothetical protein